MDVGGILTMAAGRRQVRAATWDGKRAARDAVPTRLPQAIRRSADGVEKAGALFTDRPVSPQRFGNVSATNGKPDRLAGDRRQMRRRNRATTDSTPPPGPALRSAARR